jgi:hypothetical protein
MPAVVIAAAVAGTAATVYSANKASKTATNINNQNQAEIDQTQAENTALLKPYTDSTNAAGKAYNGFIGLNGAEAQTAAKGQFDSYKDAAGYNFNLQNGSDALNSSNAAKGMLKSGSALKGLTKFQTDLANTYAQNWLGNVGNSRDNAFNAANALAGNNSAMLGQSINSTNNMGNAQIGATTAQGNALSNLASTIGGAYAYGQGLGKTTGSSYGGRSTGGIAGGGWQPWMGA